MSECLETMAWKLDNIWGWIIDFNLKHGHFYVILDYKTAFLQTRDRFDDVIKITWRLMPSGQTTDPWQSDKPANIHKNAFSHEKDNVVFGAHWATSDKDFKRLNYLTSQPHRRERDHFQLLTISSYQRPNILLTWCLFPSTSDYWEQRNSGFPESQFEWNAL